MIGIDSTPRNANVQPHGGGRFVVLVKRPQQMIKTSGKGSEHGKGSAHSITIRLYLGDAHMGNDGAFVENRFRSLLG